VTAPVKNTYKPLENREMRDGFGGVEHWTFKAVTKGRAELRWIEQCNGIVMKSCNFFVRMVESNGLLGF
jgi:predicted secreted protein